MNIIPRRAVIHLAFEPRRDQISMLIQIHGVRGALEYLIQTAEVDGAIRATSAAQQEIIDHDLDVLREVATRLWDKRSGI